MTAGAVGRKRGRAVSECMSDRQPASTKTASLFYERWSPKAFEAEPLTEEELTALFDAARWAPSSFNEQPWRFIYSRTVEERDEIAGTLSKKNRHWAGRAPHLAIVLAKRRFSKNGKPNTVAEFDTGSAWMSLTIQARMLGIHTHAMGGFDRDSAASLTGIDPDEFKPMCVIAIGRRGSPDVLPEGVEERSDSSPRKPIEEIAIPLAKQVASGDPE